jgi:hypothetical protein
VTTWSTLQLSWTIILLGSQIWQVFRQMTTLEVSNLGRYGFMGGRGGTSLREQSGALANHLQTSHNGVPPDGQRTSPEVDVLGAGAGQSGAEEDGLMMSNDEHERIANTTTTRRGLVTNSTAAEHTHRSQGRWKTLSSALSRLCMNGALLQLLGLDRFTKGAAGRGMKLAQERGSNPFDMGGVAVSTFHSLLRYLHLGFMLNQLPAEL